MKLLATAIVIAPLMLLGALPAGAGQSTSAFGSSTPVELAAGGHTAADRDTYTQKAQAEMQEWQRKLHDFGETAEAKGKAAGNAAEEDLNKAWAMAEAASRKLQAASAEGWESAKASYDKASHELAESWHKVGPEDK